MSQFDAGGFNFNLGDVPQAGDPFAFSSISNPFSGLPQAQQPTLQNLSNFVASQGGSVTPSGEVVTFVAGGPGSPGSAGNLVNTVPLSSFESRFRSAQPGASEQLSAALQFDIQNQQAAGERQFARNQEQIDLYEQALGEGVSGILSTAEATGADLVTGALADRDSLLGRLDDIEQRFIDRTDRDLSATVGGIERRFASTQKLFEAGLNPDGTQMTEAQRQQFAATMAQTRSNEVTQAATQIRSRFNEVQAQLGTTLGGLEGQANQRVQAARAAQASLVNASRVQALQFELAGRGQMAELVRNNRESVTSLFASLAGLAQLQTTPYFGYLGSLV